MAQAFYVKQDREIVGRVQDELELERSALEQAFEKVSKQLAEMKSVSADYSVLPEDYLLLADSSAATITLTLPKAADAGKGKRFLIKKVALANDVVIAAQTGETIDSGASLTLAAAASKKLAVELISDGVDKYYAIASFDQ